MEFDAIVDNPYSLTRKISVIMTDSEMRDLLSYHLMDVIIDKLANKFIEENKLTFEEVFETYRDDNEFRKLVLEEVFKKLCKGGIKMRDEEERG
jgi:hypothetical protein